MTRDKAYIILTKYLTNKNLIKHCLATEAVMKALAKELRIRNPFGLAQGAHESGIDENKWGIVGLLHDADYELSKGHPEKHGLLLFEKEKDVPDDIAYAIKSHNFENTKVMPKSFMDWGITCCDELTGLIVACALVHPASPAGGPDRKLASLTPEFILKRMKEKSFAKGADRKPILMCEEKLGIPLKEFISINLKSMQSINNGLGL